MNWEWERAQDFLEVLEAEDYLLLLAVLLLPWAFGGVEIWAYRSASLLIAAGAAVAIAKHGAAGLGLGRGRGKLWLLPALLLAGWAAVQVVPLPPQAIGVLSPEADRIYRATFPGYDGHPVEDVVAALEQDALQRVEEAGTVAPTGSSDFRMEVGGRWSGWRTLSLQPGATVERLFWFLALLMGFLLVLERTSDLERWRIYRTLILGMFVMLAMVGLVQAATWNGKILWIREAPERTHPFGPYINPTNFGGAMEIAVAWMAGYTWAKFRRPEGATLWRSIAPVAAGATALCFIAALASASKAVAVLVVVSLSLMCLVAVRGGRQRLGAVAVLLMIWGGAVAALWLTPVGERVQAFMESQAGLLEGGRIEAWRTGLAILQDYWFTGAGFGSFREVFPAYVPPGDYTQWAQLHNDYLEVLLEGGIVAGFLVLWLLAGFFRRAARGLRTGPGSRLDLEAAGVFLGVLSLMVHAFGDFNHQIPANALLFVAAGAMLVSRRRAVEEARV